MPCRAHYVTICCRFHCHQSHDLQQLLFQRPVRFNNHRRGLWMGQTKRSLHVPKSWTLLIFLVSIAQHCLNYQLPIPLEGVDFRVNKTRVSPLEIYHQLSHRMQSHLTKVEQVGAHYSSLYARLGLHRAVQWHRWMKTKPALHDVSGWMHASKNNVHPLVLPWLDDFA